jgi:CheY-like chemotaxis protein
MRSATAAEKCLRGLAGPKELTARPGLGLHVLLAEGDAGNAEFMTELLEADGHQVQIARNGPSAVQLAQANPPDVVLLEIRLPGMDGWEVARRLPPQAGGMKPFCIAITSCATEADRRRSEEAGIDLHLEKPVDLGSLRGLLRRFQRVILPREMIPEEKADAGGDREPIASVATRPVRGISGRYPMRDEPGRREEEG